MFMDNIKLSAKDEKNCRLSFKQNEYTVGIEEWNLSEKNVAY